MSDLNVLFLTEGSKKIGLGHLTRCSALYDAFVKKNIQPKMLIYGDESVSSILTGKNYYLLDWVHNESNLEQYLNNTICIIDSYKTPLEKYQEISSKSVLCAYIDDNNRLHYPKGIVINSNIYADQLPFPQDKNITYLLRTQYIPLRACFSTPVKRKKNKGINSIMLTFGGDDIQNMTPKIMRSLLTEIPHIKLNVVIGSGFSQKNIKQIQDMSNDKTTLIYYPNDEKMKKTMVQSDIAISAGGQTLYELIVTKTPTIAITIADNQVNNVMYLSKTNFVQNAGYWNNSNLDKNILKCIHTIKNNFRKKNETKQSIVIDGRGATRIVSAIIKHYLLQKAVIRRVKETDKIQIFHLSNQKDVRNNSFTSNKIDYTDHEKWFHNIMKDRNDIFIIMELDGKIIAQARLQKASTYGTVSISVKDDYKSLGIGGMLLSKLEKLAEQDNLEEIHAYIKKSNHNSIRFFKKNDYTVYKHVTINRTLAVVLTKKINLQTL